MRFEFDVLEKTNKLFYLGHSLKRKVRTHEKLKRLTVDDFDFNFWGTEIVLFAKMLSRLRCVFDDIPDVAFSVESSDKSVLRAILDRISEHTN